MPKYDEWRLGNDENTDLVSCPSCNGSGVKRGPWITGYVECSACQGYGELERNLAEILCRAARAEQADLNERD